MLKNSSLNRRIREFVTWANHEVDRHGLPEQPIAEDPHGAIGTSRLRRSLPGTSPDAPVD
ncbi:hypothetical protein [Streptomyces sp. NBC_00829]|uniref:hypothetical protein n=1 Tax=Streptomyces sp. NBC_00829 TaxID=2903679 RepID=UPI00386F9C57|nr:hypothetical protein OG293_38115 [Streptomyces sp. NBC_00829]